MSTKLIPISSSVLKRQATIGDAIWTYLWFLDHITQTKPTSVGELRALVSGGEKLKPADIAKDLGLPVRTVKRHIALLCNTGFVSNKGTAAPDEFAQEATRSTNAGTAIKNNANAAQFNDVGGALDSVEQTARDLTTSGGSLNSPGVVAALATPHSSTQQWLQSLDKARLTPQERAYVQSNIGLHENIQGLRKSSGGGATDSQVENLLRMAPGASTPDLNYLMGQTGQIRSTATRLGKGATTATGGLSIPGQQKSATAPRSGNSGSGMITVQVPGYPPGQIHASQRDLFIRNNPGAKVVTSGR